MHLWGITLPGNSYVPAGDSGVSGKVDTEANKNTQSYSMAGPECPFLRYRGLALRLPIGTNATWRFVN